jgi:hypothetical protein
MLKMKTKLLFNPFIKIAGGKALLFGVLGMFLAGYVSFYSQTHFDGVLNIHSGYQGSMLMHMIWPFADVLFLSLWFWLAAAIFSKTKYRIIDIFGTQAFAFLPIVPASVLGFYKGAERLAERLQDIDPKCITPDMFPLHDLLGVIVLALVVLTLTACSGVWIFNAFKTSANLPNKIVIPLFIGSIIAGMFLPKFIIHRFFM